MAASGLPPISTGVIEDFEIATGDKEILTTEVSVTDVYVYESILSPSIQMSFNVQDTSHILKNYFNYKVDKKNEMPNVSFTLKNLNLEADTKGESPEVQKTVISALKVDNMHVYRMDSRKPVNYHIDEFTIHLCTPSTIKNLKTRMSGFYKMKELSKVIDDAMESAGINKDAVEIEKTDLKRDYISNNQHPFQVISEIADMATRNKRVQFLHFMTAENISKKIPKSKKSSNRTGKHYFKSIDKLINQSPIFDFVYSEKGADQTFAIHDIMTYEFPCEFDTLLDLTSGIIDNEKDYEDHKPSMVSINPFDGGVFMVDGKIFGDHKRKGFGGALNAGAWSNKNNFESLKTSGTFIGASTVGDPSRPSSVEKYLHKRTEVLSFLHRENLNLKIIVPFNPKMHVGKTINVSFFSKRENEKKFGSGKYLICHMTHNIKVGGYSTTTLECLKIEEKMARYKEVRPKHQILKDMPGLAKNK